MKRQEYIGVSGVVCEAQQEELKKLFEQLALDKQRVLQLGIKATHKPQFLDIENKYGRAWYPVGDEIAHTLHPIQPDTPMTAVAQVAFEPELVRSSTYQRAFLEKLAARTTNWLTGVQYDMVPWTDDDMDISKLITTTKETMGEDIVVTLQCQGAIMERHSPRDVSERLKRMDDLAFVLFDSSCGRGMPMNTEQLLPYIQATADTADLAHIGIAVGGGLNAENVHMKMPLLLREFPQLSWDAEGQLHPVNRQGERPLDMDVCRAYLGVSAEVLPRLDYNQ